MGMKLNEIEQDVVRNAPYWSLKDGDILKGSFLSDDFKREESQYMGKPVIKYSSPFQGSFNGGEVMIKPYSMSGALIKRISDTAIAHEQSFLNSIFKIQRKNKNGKTEYEIVVLGKKDNPVKQAREEVDDVPF